MKFIKHISIILALLLFVSSCETAEKVEDFPLRPSKLVLNCYFNPDSTWVFQVSNSLSSLDNAELQLIKNATLLLYQDGEFLDTIKFNEEDQLYHNYSVPEVSKLYSVSATAPGFDSAIYAEDIIPEPVSIKSIETVIIDSSSYFTNEIGVSHGSLEGYFLVTIDDPKDQENYYMISAMALQREYYYEYNYDTEKDTSYLWEFFSPVIFNSVDPALENSVENARNIYFSDDLFDGLSYSLKLDFDEYQYFKDQTYTFKITSLSKAAYLYKVSTSLYQDSYRDIFAEPVSIFSNIENGFGIFAGQSSDTLQIFPLR